MSVKAIVLFLFKIFLFIKVKLYDLLFYTIKNSFRKFSELGGENNCISKYICFFSELLTFFNVIRLKKSLNLKFKCNKSLIFGVDFSF